MIIERLQSSIEVKKQIISNKELIFNIEKAAEILIDSFKKGNKTLFCGNGGSAADAQHLAAELSGRFYFDRPPLPAEACHTNTSFITAASNDYGYRHSFSRYIKAMGKEGDVLIGLSTSGNSENVIEAFKAAKDLNMFCIGFTGSKGGKMKDFSDILLNIPSNDTPRIQEAHITIGHILCEIVEQTLFGRVS
jgi:D-sedoheptulose 7-phosphate isomerase